MMPVTIFYLKLCKLQQIRFLYSLFKLSEKDRSDFCTSLIFTAGKEGKRYGPYGKIF